MALKPQYKPDSKKSIIVALQMMIDNLRENLRISEKVSFDLDTEDEHKKMLDDCPELPSRSPEELRQEVEEAKDRSIRELGHIQRRIDEVSILKEAFEAKEIPSPQILNKTYQALRSSLVFEAINLCIGNPREKIFATGIAGLSLGQEKADEVERLGKTIEAYSEALMFGFRLTTFLWNEFPFDDL